MVKEKLEERRELVHLPEVSKRASKLIANIEKAKTEPTSLDVCTPGEIPVVDFYLGLLDATDNLYRVHEELFFRDFNKRSGAQGSYDYERTLALTEEILKLGKSELTFERSALLGLMTLQLVETGAQFARDPSLVITDLSEQPMEAIIQKIEDYSGLLYQEKLADRIPGDFRELPRARFDYLGGLTTTHYNFWSGVLIGDRVDPDFSLIPDLEQKIQRILRRFPQKYALFNARSAEGDPYPHLLRERDMHRIENFRISMHKKVSRGPLVDQVSAAFRTIGTVMEAADLAGYTSEEMLRIVAQNSHVIGRITERSSDNVSAVTKDHIQFTGPRENPIVVINYPSAKVAPPYPEAAEFMEQRGQTGGICPARGLVHLQKDGDMHTNVQTLVKGVRKRLGVEPALLKKEGKEVYLDPAAHIMALSAFALAYNS